jgi:hypothetical protein
MTNENTLRQNMASMITPMIGFEVVNAIKYRYIIFPPFKNVLK